MKILVIYTSAGLGHQKIAENIGAVLKEEHDVDLLDLFSVEPGPVVEYGKKIYYWIINFLPGLWKFFYTNKFFIKTTLPFRTTVAGLKHKKVLNILINNRYDAVVCAHTNASAILSYIKNKGYYKGKFIIAFSDFHLHPYWLYDNADLYLANVQEQKDQMVARGISAEKIAVCGVTVPEKREFDLQEIRKKYSLEQTDKAVLVMGGSRGLGIESETVSQIIKTNAMVYIVCGTNEVLKNKYQAAYGNYPNVQVLGFVDLHELYAVADLVVTKPGGLTVTECLCYNLPILVSYCLPGQEQMNYEYLQDHQLVMPEFLDIYGAASDELQTATFANDLKRNPNVRAVVQHGSAIKQAISVL